MPVRTPSTGKAGVTVFGVTPDRRRTILVATVVAAVVLTLAFVGPKVLGDTSDGSVDADRATNPVATEQPAGQAPIAPAPMAPTASSTASVSTPAASAPSTPVPSTPVPSTPVPSFSAPSPAAAPSVPKGWYLYKDSTGFSVPVPNGWSMSRRGSEVYFQDRSQAGWLLIVDQTDQPVPDPVADWTDKERDRRGGYRNYRRIKIQSVPYWDKAADWEFARTSDRGNALRVVKRGFITAPDKAYGISWSTSASDWVASQDDLAVIYKGFRPAGG